MHECTPSILESTASTVTFTPRIEAVTPIASTSAAKDAETLPGSTEKTDQLEGTETQPAVELSPRWMVPIGTIKPTVELPPHDNKGGDEAPVGVSPQQSIPALDAAIAAASHTGPIDPRVQFKSNQEDDEDANDEKLQPAPDVAAFHVYVATEMTDASQYIGVAYAEKLALIKAKWAEAHPGYNQNVKVKKQSKETKKKQAKGDQTQRKSKTLKTSPPYGCTKCRAKVTGCANCNPELMKKCLLKKIEKLRADALDGFEVNVARHLAELKKHCSHLIE